MFLSRILQLSKLTVKFTRYTRNYVWFSFVKACILGQKPEASCIQQIENRLVYDFVIYSGRV